MSNISSIKVIQEEIAVRTLAEGLLQVTKLLPNPSKVLKSIVKTIEVFETTLKQPDIAAVSRRYRDGVKKLDWDVSRVTQRGDRADFVKSVCRDMDLNSIIPAALSARDFGFTVLEAKWEKVGKYSVITSLVEKPREWFRFNYANELLLISREKPEGVLVHEVWPRKFIVVQHEASYKNPYGNGLLDEAYWYGKGLAANFEYHLSFLEDDGRDHWFGWVPPGSDPAYEDKVELALRKLRNAAVAVIQEGTRIEKNENKGRSSTSESYEVFKHSCRSTINMLWLGSDLAVSQKSVGSFASSKSGMEVQDDAIESGKELPEFAINQAVKWMGEVNTFPGDAAEEVAFYLYKAPKSDKEQAEIDQIYSVVTGRKPSSQLLAKRGYEDGDFEDPAAIAPATVHTFESGYSMQPLFNAVEGLKKKY